MVALVVLLYGGNMKRGLIGKSGLILVTLGVACIMVIPFLQSKKWVRRTDLKIRFIVTDEETGTAIKDAIIHVRAERGGFCEERGERQFDLVTDDRGNAQRLCRNCMCFGSRGAFEDTFALHLPWWSFQVSAPGYISTKSMYLNVPERVQDVKREDGRATLSIAIALQEDKRERDDFTKETAQRSPATDKDPRN